MELKGFGCRMLLGKIMTQTKMPNLKPEKLKISLRAQEDK